MKTGNTKAEIQTTRLLSSSDLKDRLIDYYESGALTLGGKVFTQGSVFGSLSLISGGNDEISVTGSAIATDGLGYFFDVAECVNADPAVDFMTDIVFENTNATIYQVALKRCRIPSGIQANPRTGAAELIGYTDFIGESAAPSGVVDNGDGTMRIRLSGAQTGGITQAGRYAYVWKVIPETTGAQYMYFGTVGWTGVYNYVDVPHYFGQTVPSTTAADYLVVIAGPTVFRTTANLDITEGYAFLGTVTGAGAGNPPVTFDISGQVTVDFSLSTLNDALDEYSQQFNTSSSGIEVAGKGTALPVTARHYMATFTYNDQIYIVGGVDDAVVSHAHVYSYSTSANAWTAKTSVPTQGGITGALNSYRIATVGSKAYIMGGTDNGGVPATLKLRIYDAALNSYSAGADMPAARYAGHVGAIGTKIYYAGGVDSGGTVQDTCYEYDTVANTWSVKSVMPSARYHGGAAVIGDKLYVIAGQNAGGFFVDTVYCYDPVLNSWSTLNAFPRSAAEIGVALYDGQIHAIGGMDTEPAMFHYVYNEDLDTWLTIDDPSATRPATPPVVCGIRGHVLGADSYGLRIIGGRYQAEQTIGTFTSCTYNLGLDLRGFKLSVGDGMATSVGIPTAISGVGSATTLEAFPEALNNVPAVRVGRVVYLMGGDLVQANAASAKCWRWAPDTQTFHRLADMSMPRAGHGMVYHPQEHAIYVCGGRTAIVTSAVGVERYDIATNTWSTVNTSLDRNGFGQAWLVGDRIWMFGGGSGGASEGPGTTITYYDIRKRTVTNSATTLAASRRFPLTFAMPRGELSAWPNRHPAHANIFIMGGDSGVNVQTQIYVFDTESQTIVTLTPTLSAARGYAYCTPIEEQPGKVLIVGGVSPTNAATTRVDVLDMGTLTLTQVATMPAARLNPGAAEIDGVFYSFAGGSGTLGARTSQSPCYGFKGSYAGRLRLGLQNYTSGAKGDSIAFAGEQLHGWHSWMRGVYQDMIRSGNR